MVIVCLPPATLLVLLLLVVGAAVVAVVAATGGLGQCEAHLWAEGVRSLSAFLFPHHVRRHTAVTSVTAAAVVFLREI